MATDAFITQIIHFVRREMSDEAILTLVKNQLMGTKAFPAALAPMVKAKPGRKPGPKPAAPAGAALAKRGPGRPRKATSEAAPGKRAPKGKAAKRGRGSAAGRQELLVSIEKIVKSGGGVAASEVAKAAGIPQSRASAALKELKSQKKIFQGGDRRFARYAGDAKTAEQASLHARKHASGPVLRSGKKK